MKKYRLRLFIYALILVGILALLGVSCLSTWEQIYKNRQTRDELEKKYSTLIDEEEDLENEVIKLQDPEYVAKYAREKYLYTAEGELIIDMTDDKH